MRRITGLDQREETLDLRCVASVLLKVLYNIRIPFLLLNIMDRHKKEPA